MKIFKGSVKFLKKFIKSKAAVLLVLLGLGVAGYTQTTHASSNYVFSTVYQYYMLDNSANAMKDQGSEQKVAANMASLGSGGISGSFSYSDIVNSAPKDVSGSETIARKFVSMMATYSTFKYFSNKVQGFESIPSYLGRPLVMIGFMPIALIMDIVNLLIPTLLKILAKLNIITFLGSMITNQPFATDMANALGISKGTFKQLTDALLSFAVGAILISLFFALRRGSGNIDQKHFNKFKGRLFSLVALPLAVGFGATLLNDIGDMTSKMPQLNATFSRYLVDDRSWAYNFNFAPSGNSTSSSDIGSNSKGSFVDLTFDPYTDAGGKRIQAINDNSSLAGKGTIFGNSSLLIAYGTSQSFSATDYINFQGSKESQNLLNGTGGTTYGSYYYYANSVFSDKKLLDVDNAYHASGGAMDKGSQEGPYQKAIDDYKTDDKLNAAKSTAWRDRYIYGSKVSGALDKYYGEAPSQEQVQNSVGGTKGSTVPSDQSMFLILSTIFDETGGRYYIPAPARGIKSLVGQFDSNRSDYYVVSMVGTPFFTLIGMLTQPLLVLTSLLALITALFSIGLVDMNVRPAKTFFKGLTLGDIEYSGAFTVYSIGIAGTIMLFMTMPGLLVTFMMAVSNLVVKGIPTLLQIKPSTPQTSLAYNGVPLLISGVVGVVFFILWLKSNKFRILINELFTWIWSWALATGERLERQAGGLPAMGAKGERAKLNNKNKLLEAMDKWNNGGISNVPTSRALPDPSKLPGSNNSDSSSDPNSFSGTNQPIQASAHKDEADDDPNNPTPGAISVNKQKPKSAKDIKRRGQYDRIKQGLYKIQNDPHTDPKVVSDVLDAQNSVDEFRKHPTQQNFDDAQKHLALLKQHLVDNGAPKEQIDAVDSAMNELNNLGKSYNLKPRTLDPNNSQVVKSNNSNKQANQANNDGKPRPNGQVPKKKDVNRSKSSDAKEVVTQDRPNKPAQDDINPTIRRHTTKTAKNGQNVRRTGKKQAIDVTDKETTVTNHVATKPDVHVNPTRVIKDTQLKGVMSSLGDASNSKQVRRALKQMRRATNPSEVKRSIRNLQKSVRTLDRKAKKTINKQKLINNLINIQNKHK